MKTLSVASSTPSIVALLLLLTAWAPSACGDDPDSPAQGSAGSSSNAGGSTSAPSGVTPCGAFPDSKPKACQAGQYCADERLSKCEGGCLSDANCTSAQECTKQAGNNLGSCQTKAQPSDPCGPFCSKLKACNPSLSDADCNRACQSASEACRGCIADINCSNPLVCQQACGF